MGSFGAKRGDGTLEMLTFRRSDENLNEVK